METNPLRNEKGVALVIALIMLIVLTFIGIASISSSIFEAKIAGNERWGSAALYAASAGIADGISRLPNISAYGTLGVGPDERYYSGNLTSGSAQPQKNLGLAFKPGFDPTFEFKRFQVNAVGESFGARKEIEVQVLLGPYPGGTSYNN